MKKAAFCILVFLMLSVSIALAADPVSLLTQETWVSASGSEASFGQNGKGTFASYAMTYKVSGKNVQISYTIPLQRGTEKVDYPVTADLYLIDDGDYLCLAREPDASWKEGIWFPKSRYANMLSEAGSSAQIYDAAFGEEIDLGFLKFTLNEVRSIRSVGENGYTIKADENGVPLVFMGSVENTGKKEINLEHLGAFLITQDGSGSALVRVETGDSMEMTLPPLGKGKLYIARNLNDQQRSHLSGAALVLSMDEKLEKSLSFPYSGDFNLRWTIDQKTAENKSVSQVEREYFSECPALPAPGNFVTCSQVSQFTTSTNGRVSSITYTFAPGGSSSGSQLASQYSEHLKSAGYTVKKSGSTYTVSYKNKKLAEFYPDGANMVMSITPGNQNFSSRP